MSPTSVLYNWLDELEVWGYFKVGKFHRNSKDEVIDLVKQKQVELVLTTHETMRIYIVSLFTSCFWFAIYVFISVFFFSNFMVEIGIWNIDVDKLNLCINRIKS